MLMVCACVFEFRSTLTEISTYQRVRVFFSPPFSLLGYVHKLRYVSPPTPVSSQHYRTQKPDNGGHLCCRREDKLSFGQ